MDVTKVDLEQAKAQAEQRVSKHELACEKRYGEVHQLLAELRVSSERNTKILYALLFSVISLAIKVIIFP